MSTRDYTKEANYWAWAAEESRTPGSGIINTKKAIRQFQDLCAEAAAKQQAQRDSVFRTPALGGEYWYTAPDTRGA